MLSPRRHNFHEGTWRRTVTVPRCPHFWRSLGGEIMPDSLRSPAVQLARDGHEFRFDMSNAEFWSMNASLERFERGT